jgi:hypothetical protein
MRLKILILVTLMSLATPTFAQLVQCTGAIWIAGSWFGGVCVTTTPNPAYTPGPNDNSGPNGGIDIDEDTQLDLNRSMATAAAVVNKLPEEISKSGPGGQTLAQAMAGSKQVFGYIKWLFSPNSAQELLGRSLAPVGINILVIFTMIVALTAIYIAINIVVYIIKFVVWIITQMLKLVPFW